MSKPRRNLNTAENYNLIKLLDNPEARKRLVEFTDEENATYFGQGLPFAVHDINIQSARKILGVTKYNKSNKTKDTDALMQLIEGQASKISRLEHNVQNLLDRVTQLERRPR